ncbi:MAG: TolC family protein [Planctomycetota bacterium]|nr:MAG: TolC family protein [Planctomycetota bacterium]
MNITAPALCVFLCITTLAWSSAAEPEHWLTPLVEAAASPLTHRSEVNQAQLEVRRSRLAIDREQAAWRPRFFADGSHNRRVESSNDATETGNQQRTIRVNEVRSEVGIAQPLATGTNVQISALSSRETNNRANALNQESWVSRVRLTINQELLRGRNRDANLAPLNDAREQWEGDQERLQQEIALSFRHLAEQWIAYGRSVAAHDHAEETLASASSTLELAQARHHAGLVGRSELLARERDVVEQQAQLGRLQRAMRSEREQLRMSWGDVALPPPPQDVDSDDTLPDIPAFAETIRGQLAAREIAAQQRASHRADQAGMDSLTLSLGAGLSGRDGDGEGSWQQVNDADTYDVSVGLRYEHIIGGSRERAERQRSRIALRQQRLAYQASEREWHLSVDRAVRTLLDARSDVHERARIRQAVGEERDLIAAELSEGTASIRELIDAEQRLRSAEQALINARYSALESELILRELTDTMPLPEIDL